MICCFILKLFCDFNRFGSFEIFKGVDSVTGREGPSVGRTDILATMLDYTVKMFYPEVGYSSRFTVAEFYNPNSFMAQFHTDILTNFAAINHAAIRIDWIERGTYVLISFSKIYYYDRD